MDREDVIDLLSIVSAIDHRTIGEMDIGVWAAMLGGRASEDDCAMAIMDHFREQPNIWLTPGHVVQRVKTMVNDRIARQELPQTPPASMQHRVNALAEITEILADEHPRSGPYVNPLLVSCDFCGSAVGEHCTKAGMPGKPRENLEWIAGHPSRIEKAAIALGYSAGDAARVSTVMSRRQASVLSKRGPRFVP
jgi:hypothetical protein